MGFLHRTFQRLGRGGGGRINNLWMKTEYCDLNIELIKMAIDLFQLTITLRRLRFQNVRENLRHGMFVSHFQLYILNI